MRVLKAKDKSNYKNQMRLALIGFLFEMPTFIMGLVSGIMSNTILVWADLFSSLQSVVHYVIVFFVAKKLTGDTGDEFNHGVERLESFIAFICDILIAIGILVVIAVSIFGIISPSASNDSLIFFLFVKVYNISFDIFFLVGQYKTYKQRKNRMTQTELGNCKKSLTEDVIILVVALICYFCRSYEFSWYLSPIASILLSLYFLFFCIRRLGTTFFELSDRSIDIKAQDEIYDIVLNNRLIIKRILEVNCRKLNDIVHVDIKVVFRPETTYKEEMETLYKIDEEIEKAGYNAVTSFVLQEDSDK